MRENRSHLVVLGLVLAVLAAVFAVGYTNPIRLGLDLKGGLEIVLKAVPSKGQELTTEQLTKSVEVIRERVDSLGVAEPEIRTQGTDQIAIELPGEKDPDRAVRIVGSTALLRFYSFQENFVGSKAYRNEYDILKKAETRATESIAAAQKKLDAAEAKLEAADTPAEKQAAKAAIKKAEFDEAWYLFDAENKLVASGNDKDALLAKAPGGKLDKGWELLAVPAGEVLLRGNPDQMPVQVAETGKFDREKGVFILLEDNPALTGEGVRSATGESSNGEWVTSILFTRAGGKKFGEVTEQIAKRGALQGNPQAFAIVLDDEIKSTPTIDYRQYPNGIKGTSAQITGLDDREEAQDLALVLNTGALPVKFEVISKTAVSATLGAQSLKQGLLAGAAGLLIVMVYLIIFYRFLGIIADIALLVYAFIFYGIIVAIPITMTLPGIAGMILTIAVAADANIIIFERIREEYRAGRSVGRSIQAGYTKGLRTIIDANVVTLITAAVLFVIAAGSVRGFALLLFVGTVLSMFTAIAATYAMLGLLGRSKHFTKPWVIGGSRKELVYHFQWMKWRRVMFGFVAAVIVTSLLLIGVKELNLGVDFKSGTKFDVTVAKDASSEEIRTILTAVDEKYANATIQRTQDPSGTDTSDGQSYTIRVEKLSTEGGTGATAEERSNNAQQAAEKAVFDALDEKFDVTSKNVTTIGPSFGKQVLQGAVIAIFVSLALEVLYISLRFEFRYALPVLVALAHDMILALGAYALTGREFTSATVAALLTILGYSLYDTIIVFDRIRENIHIMRKSTFARITDASLNEVLMRSINTTLVVVGPIGALYFFGGATLQDFAFALLIGIVAGAYSSIIIASPILCWIMERDPVWKRRKEIEEGIATDATEAAQPGEGAGALDGRFGDEYPDAASDDADAGVDELGDRGPSGRADAGSSASSTSSTTSTTSRRDRRSRAQRRKS